MSSLKSFRALATALAISGAALFSNTASEAELQQVPGYFHKAVGDYVVTAIYDGYVSLSPKELDGLTQDQIQSFIAREFQEKNSDIQTAVNSYRVQYQDKLILIDSGSSDCFGPTMGHMVSNIKAAGFNPADVDAVLLTHMHPDHACGVTLPDGTAAFPNATVWAEKKDADFWLNDASMKRLPESQREFVIMAKKAIAPFAAKGRFKVFSPGDELFPGLKAVESNGHTPGHTSCLVGAGKDKLLVWGDIVHFHAVQLPHPEVTIDVDVSPKGAVASRKAILALAADNQWLVAAAHHPFPGLGHVRREAVGYSWVPAQYGPLSTSQPQK